MKQLGKSLILVLLAVLLSLPATTAAQETPTVKKERNHIRSGNKLYKDKRYAEAEVEYRKALQANPQSGIGQFNLATTLMRQGTATAAQNDEKNPMNEAETLLQNLVKTSPSRDLQSKAYYDLGNIAYARQQYDQAIDHYKNALRRNPDDDHARDNLRLAQLKRQEQQQNQQDKNQNKDNNQDKDKNQQDKDKQNQDKKDKEQDKQNTNQEQQDQQNKQKNQEQQGGMSQQNVEQVLKAMQDQERATQQKMNAEQARQQRAERARTNRKW